ncbi:MAG: aliphatic sulfonate ABC transporter substrate-binding protein [Mesorhizobium sp.]
MISRRLFNILSGAALGLAALSSFAGQAFAEVTTLKLGYSYATPSTLILKEKGWLENELKAKGISVEWVLSRGSNQTLEFIRSGSIDFGASAGSAALLGHANGTPNKVIAWLSRGEFTALLTLPDSGIKSLEDLRGKKVAATRATEPYLFLLRALEKANIPASEVEVVPLQHPEGRVALESRQVDAWAALDPDFAITEINAGSIPFYRDETLITGGVLNVHTKFAEDNPELVELVLKGIIWATKYAKDNPKEALELYATAGKLDAKIAERSFNRNVLDQFQITDQDYKNLIASGEILKSSGSIPADTDIEAATKDLLEPKYINVALTQ